MLEFLNRLSGMIVGGVLYPLKSLLINVLIAAAGVVLAPFAWAAVPFLVFSGIYADMRGDILWTLIFAIPFGILGAVGGILLFPFFAVGAAAFHAAIAIFDLFRNFFNGLEEGIEEGLFNHVLSEGLLGLWRFSTVAEHLGQEFGFAQENSAYAGAPPLPPFAIDTHHGAESRVHGSSRAELNGSYTAPEDSSLLTADELTQAGTIVGLTVVLERYNGLLMELQSLDSAIAAREPGKPLDETFILDKLTGMEIDNPSLLVKQYYDAGQWKVVPLSTYIIDRAHLECWLISHNSHPLTRDPIIDNLLQSPSAHVGRPTRYRILEYRTIANAQELVEAASTIRAGINPAYTDTFSAAEPGDRPVSFPRSSNSAFTLFGRPIEIVWDVSEVNRGVMGGLENHFPLSDDSDSENHPPVYPGRS